MVRVKKPVSNLAFKTFFLYLFGRHHIEDARQALYDAANKWMKAVQQKGTPFFGGQQPNLADVSVYGVLSSIEGCTAFQELRHHTNIGKWYDEMSNMIQEKRGQVLAVSASAN